MKHKTFVLIISLLTLSLLCNGLLFYYVSELIKPKPSITKFSFTDYDTFIYCERSADVKSVNIDMQKGCVTIGESKFLKESGKVYLIGKDGKINLSSYDAEGFIINSDGELLYSATTPTLKKEKVFITPKGEKYHTDAYCAGKTGFEAPLETAKLLEREPCKICAQ